MLDLPLTEFVYFTYRHAEYTFAIERNRVLFSDLTYLISGEMTYLYNDEEIRLHAGDAVFFPQGSIRERRETAVPVRYASINVHFADGFTPSFAGYLPGCTTPAVLPILEIMSDIHHSASDYADRQCLSLFAYLYYELASSMSESSNPYVRDIKCYISNHISEKMTLREIADSVHLTPEYCCSLFKKHVGKSVFSYILEQRTATAKRLIALGDTSLKSISSEMGFADYNYFSRTFKRITGVTPSEYKASCESGLRM